MSFENILNKVEKRLWFLINGYSLPMGIGKEDLYQEAIINLYDRFLKGECEDKNGTYLVNSCRFALNNYIRKKRKTNSKISIISLGNFGKEIDEGIFNRNYMESKNSNSNEDIYLDEIINAANLSLRETEVLKLLFSGYTLRQCGKNLGVSHVMILKIKNRICEKIERLPEFV
jgi:RNA polymerase sigma factor (sigma-70 family)